jgi:hypothetical protein
MLKRLKVSDKTFELAGWSLRKDFQKIQTLTIRENKSLVLTTFLKHTMLNNSVTSRI